MLCALFGSRFGQALPPPPIQAIAIMGIALLAGLASAIRHALQRRRRLRGWLARLANAHASLSWPPVHASNADAASPVTETVTVILRRQTPPRLEEPPRSWLGGLPMLPGGVPWPRSVSSEYPDRGGRPLHFAAQICCADLPPDLWAGLGPRHGWLLLFLDPNQGAPDGPDAFAILHTETLGSERPHPADLGPVQDGVYVGWNYKNDGVEDIPRLWPRWPVDLVAMPNEVPAPSSHAPTPSETRPHRMGGYPDPVQSRVTIGPTSWLLLFQLASDAAMQWCWGDLGAFHITISPADLQRGAYGQARIMLECY